MTSPLIELRDIIVKRARTQTVTVVSSTRAKVTVSTLTGTLELRNDGSLYSQGEVLMVRDSTILGRVQSENKLPVYHL